MSHKMLSCDQANIVRKGKDRQRNAGPLRDFREPGAKLKNEAPCERIEQKIGLRGSNLGKFM